MREHDELVDRYVRGEITPQERSELERSLLSDGERVADFAETLLLEQELRGQHDRASTVESRRVESWPVATPASRRETFAYLALAASLLLAATAAVIRPGGAEDAEEVAAFEAPTSPTDEVAIAYVGRTTDCTWGGPEKVEGSRLALGSSLEITSGVAEVIFENGARVTAQGPCELGIDGESRCSLRIGKASVRVPETAFGFKLATPSGIVIDLGTEFAVEVDQAGGSEVHVFEGEVAFQALKASGAFHEKALRLTETQACKYSLGGNTLEEFQANEARFDWRNRRPVPEADLPALPVRGDLALWLAADRQVETDADGRVRRWLDLVTTDNGAAEDALQLNPDNRPMLANDGINGRPVVRFGGPQSFLVTPPLHTTNEQTAVAVFALRDAKPDFQQIINYNGPPQRVVGPLGVRVKPGVFEVCLRDQDNDQRFAVSGEVFGGYRDGAPKTFDNLVRSAVSAPNTIAVGRPVVVAFRHSLNSQAMSLHVNGVERKRKRAKMPIAIASRKIIGCHPVFEDERGGFRGDLGELLLYNRALGDDEIKEVSAYLAERFALAP